ncbi:MAG: Gfo/Idh/MocA family protein [Armatimonadota bacterium]
MAEQINIGIIGSGGYGRSARQYLRNTGEFNIVACMDVNPAVAEQAAKEDGAVAYTEVEAFLAHPGMTATSINTPAWLHAEHCLKSLDAGKHIFVTKPVCATVAEAVQVRESAQAKGLSCMVGHHARLFPVARYVKEVLDSGKLGRICNAMLTCCSSGGLEQKAGDWRALPGRNPGGPMLQCGIHTLDTLLGIFGPIKQVMSMMQDDVTEFQVVDNTVTLLKFANGVQVTFVSNYTTAYMHTMDFFGTAGNLHIHEHITGLGQHEMYFQERARGPHEPWEALRIPSYAPGYPDGHGGLLEKEFARQIRGSAPNYGNFDDAISALAIIEAAVESHETGRAVAITWQRNTSVA